MKRVVGLIAGTAVLVVGVVPIAVAEVARGPAAQSYLAESVRWGPCAQEKQEKESRLTAVPVECATVRVPLDYREPMGHAIKLAINRIKATASAATATTSAPCWSTQADRAPPGGTLAALRAGVAAAGAAGTATTWSASTRAASGDSEPALHCVDPAVYYRAAASRRGARVSPSEENVLLGRAADYASQCGTMWSWLLPHMTTENTARDMDASARRSASRRSATSATRTAPTSAPCTPRSSPTGSSASSWTARSTPTSVWYKANLEQDRAFERQAPRLPRLDRRAPQGLRARRLDQAGHVRLVCDARQAARPAGRRGGGRRASSTTPSPWAATPTGSGPSSPPPGPRTSGRATRRPLIDAYNKHGKHDAEDENGYAIYLPCSAATPHGRVTGRGGGPT